MTINTASIGSEVRRISITTRLDMSPCDITVETVEAAASATVGETLTVDGITATITSVEKKWNSKTSGGSLFYFIYRAQNEPRLWAEEYSYHIYEYYGKTVAEIISEVNAKLGAWSISDTGTSGYYIRQYDNDSSLTNIIKDIADMLGYIPVLNHKTQAISFQNITTYAGTITEHDFSSEDEDLIDYAYIDEESESTGTIVNGVYNAPFYSGVKELFISVQGTAWNVELIDSKTVESDAGMGLDEYGYPITITESTEYAEVVANTTVDYENFEFETLQSGFFYLYGLNQGDITVGLVEEFPEEITTRSAYIDTGDNLHELQVQVHMFLKSSYDSSSIQYYSDVERKARMILNYLKFYVTADVLMTGEYFEESSDSGDLNTMHTYYIVPVSEGSNSSDVPTKLLNRIKWYKENKSRVNATVAGRYYAGDTFEGGRVYSSSITWERRVQEWRSSIEVIGGSSA